jgi:hypothetical protein
MRVQPINNQQSTINNQQASKTTKTKTQPQARGLQERRPLGSQEVWCSSLLLIKTTKTKRGLSWKSTTTKEESLVKTGYYNNKSLV